MIVRAYKQRISSKKENRIRRYTPAVTKVDEWTRADTGVGAAMAAGSQAEKGIWALLVMAATIISVGSHKLSDRIESKFHIIILKSPTIENQAIDKRIHTSPTRLVNTVNIPALLDFLEG